jgi:hypothetical protein
MGPKVAYASNERATELMGWCSKAADKIREFCHESDAAAREWWENEGDHADELSIVLGGREDMASFADRLQEEGYAWAGQVGELAAEADMAENEQRVSSDVERLANYFVGYLFEEYRGTKHVRRVAAWIGLLLKAIQRIAGESLARSHKRMITFEYRNRQFKARYSHDAGYRGGIEIVEVLPRRGSPEGQVAVTITSLVEAEAIYWNLEAQLDTFVDG